MKRVRSDQDLYYFPQEDFPKQDVLKWRGQLTPFQEKVSEGLIRAVEERTDFSSCCDRSWKDRDDLSSCSQSD